MTSVQLKKGTLLIRCGMGSRRAGGAAAMLLEQGANALVSWGTAGGLAPDLQSGDLLLPGWVLDTAGAAFKADQTWRAALAAGISPEMRANSNALLSHSVAVASIADKSQLFKTTGAWAVDMESAAVGAAAESAHVPFIAVRAIADPADAAVGKTALAAVDVNGQLQLLALACNLCRRPGDIASLLRLARHFDAARGTLLKVARLTDSRLAFPRAE